VLGRLDEQSRALDAALATATRDEERARALTDRAVSALRAGRTDEALRTIADAVALARSVGDAEILATARGRQATILTYAGDLDEATSALDEAGKLVPDNATGLRTLLAVWRAQLAGARGDLAQRRRAYEEAVRGYDQAGDARRAAAAETNLADVYNRVGAYGEAERALRDAVEKCRRVGNRIFEGYALANLGYALTMQRRPDEALSVLRDALALAEQIGETRLGMSVRLYRVRALAAVDSAEALREARLVADEAERSGLDGLRVLALAAAATAALALDDASAIDLSSEAMAGRDRLGSLEEGEAELFVTHARALRAAGREEEARACIARGRARLEEVAALITDPEHRRQLLEDVEAHRELTRS
jgi:tetratricopeptide (TPR) repeat protein